MRVALLALGAVGALTAVDLPFPQYHLLGALSVTVFGTAAASYVTGGFRRSVVSFSLMGLSLRLLIFLFTGTDPCRMIVNPEYLGGGTVSLSQ